MWTVLAGFTVALGPLAMFNLYFMPYWINVMWLDAVTYLHHHGPEDQQQIPWYRGEVPILLACILASLYTQSKSSICQNVMPSKYLPVVRLCMVQVLERCLRQSWTLQS